MDFHAHMPLHFCTHISWPLSAPAPASSYWSPCWFPRIPPLHPHEFHYHPALKSLPPLSWSLFYFHTHTSNIKKKQDFYDVFIDSLYACTHYLPRILTKHWRNGSGLKAPLLLQRAQIWHHIRWLTPACKSSTRVFNTSFWPPREPALTEHMHRHRHTCAHTLFIYIHIYFTCVCIHMYVYILCF